MKKNKQSLQKVIFIILSLLLPILLIIPVLFYTSFFYDFGGFEQYFNYIRILLPFAYSLLFFLWLKNLGDPRRKDTNLKELRNNCLILLGLPIVILLFFSLIFEGRVDLLGILLLGVYPVGGIELASIFGFEGIYFYIFGLGWIILLFIKYIQAFLILHIFRFSRKYMNYLFSASIALISSATGMIMIQVIFLSA